MSWRICGEGAPTRSARLRVNILDVGAQARDHFQGARAHFWKVPESLQVLLGEETPVSLCEEGQACLGTLTPASPGEDLHLSTP